ncbi:hypothetical protein GGF32_000306 [Allomyces javanicus]|nr:hypothetical protein GGF32_000306 [Allomyces javanicus]
MMLRNGRHADSASSSAGGGAASSPTGPAADYEAVSFNRARLPGTKWAKMPLVIKAKYLVSEPPSARTAADMVQKLVERQPSAITAIVLKDLVARPLSTYVSAAERRVAVSSREVQRVHGLMAIEGGDD